MKLIKYVFALMAVLGIQEVKGQVFEIDYFDKTMVGPDNVDFIYGQQIDFYLADCKLTTVKLDSLVGLQEYELSFVKSKGKIKKRDRIYIKQVEKELRNLTSKKMMVDSCRKSWVDIRAILSNSANVENLDSQKCYEIVGKDSTYLPANYKIATISIKEYLFWNELTVINEVEDSKEIEVEPATTRWEKRKSTENCLSANPEDCLVWCLVDVPAKYKTIVSQEKECPDGFAIDFNKDNCKKNRSLPIGGETTKVVKVFERSTSKEILVQRFLEIGCDE